MSRAKHRGRRVRGLIFFIAAAALMVALVICAVPVWLPWALKPLARKNGLAFSSYERRGYSEARLHDVSYTNSSITLRAESVNFLTPFAWVWNLERGGRITFLTARNWTLTSNPREKPGGPSKRQQPSTYSILTNIQSELHQLRRWLPSAELENGRFEAGEEVIAVPQLRLTNGTASAKLLLVKQGQTVDINLSFSDRAVTSARISLPQLESENLIVISAGVARATISATNRLGSKTWRATAEFAQAGQLPLRAGIDSERIPVPPTLIGMAHYSNTTAEVHGTFENGRFEFSLRGHSDARLGATGTPLELELRMRGTTNDAIIEIANVSSDWFQAALSTNAHVYFEKPYVRNPARFTITADLARQGTIPASGQIAGETDMVPTNAPLPLVRYRVQCQNLTFQKWHFAHGRIDGLLHWPVLDVAEFRTALTNGLAMVASGGVDLQSRNVSDAKVKLSGPAPAELLPKGVAAGTVEASIAAHGNLTNLVYTGFAKASEIALPGLKPITLSARWSGEGERDIAFSAAAATSNGEAMVAGTIGSIRPEINVSLQSFAITTNGVTALAGKSVTDVSFARDAGGIFSGAVSNLRIEGPAGRLEADANIHWPESGEMRLDVSDLGLSLANAFLLKSVESADVGHLHAEIGWSNSPIRMAVAASVLSRDLPFRVERLSKLDTIGPIESLIAMKSDESGLTVSNLMVSARGSPVLAGHGTLPITFTPGPRGLQFLTNAPIDFQIASGSNSVFWNQAAELARSKIKEPSLNIKVSGTWQSPVGVVQLRAARIEPPAHGSNSVIISELNLDLALDRSAAVLTNCHFLVEGQPAELRGALPLNDAFWARVNSGRMPDLAKANVSAQIDGAKIAAFAPFFPKLLAPQGTFSADVSMRPGRDIVGSFTLKDARTRPLPSIGPIRDINVRLNLAHRKVEIPNATVRIGGAEVLATGMAVLPQTFSKNALPESFQIMIRGTNVPLSRQPSSIIRADLDVSIQKTNAQAPLIAGTLNLRDSFYLSDLAALIPGKTASVKRRPPYFSVDDPALASWRLDAHVIGDHSIKVRSTLFNGTADPNLRIEGTLEDPVAIGDVRIDEGLVRFPFASLDVQQGFVALSRADPFRPRIELAATSRRFGYDVRMRLSGAVDQPVIELSSTPPLSSDELLLMVTAGELPRGGYTLTPQQRAQTVALFLGKDLLAKFGMGDSTTQRLTFTSGEDISEAGKPTYGVDYKLTKRWSLEGEYDRFNAFNAGIKWKVYSK
jgi:translocation and assembly module TamB